MTNIPYLRNVPVADPALAPKESWEEYAERRFAPAKALSDALESEPLKEELEALRERCAWDDVSIAEDYPASIDSSPYPELYRFARMLELAAVEGFVAFQSPRREPLSPQKQQLNRRFQEGQLDALNDMKLSPLAGEFSGLIKASEDYFTAREAVLLRSV